MHKQIINKDDVQNPIEEGMNAVADIVARTLGPGGLPVIIERVGQAPNGDSLGPMITKDGVTVASECADEDAQIDVIIQTVKAICQKTNRVVGDGTTTAIVLGRAILQEALKLIEEENLNPQQVRREIERVALEVEKQLDETSLPCKTNEMIGHIATISANGDEDMGLVIEKAFAEVGAEGAITVDTGTGKEHTLEIVNGFQIHRGAEAQERFLNNVERTNFTAEKCSVLIYDGVLNSPSNLSKILNEVYDHAGQGETAHLGPQRMLPPIVVVANEFTRDVIQLMLQLKNNEHMPMQLCAVRSPHQTKVTTQWLEDMATFMGGERLGNGNRSLDNFKLTDLGLVDKVVAEKYVTTFYGGQGAEEEILERIDQLKAQRTHAESAYDASIISDRLASLSQGIAKIGVGGLTDLEIKEKYHRIEDAVNAARAAIESGVVPGGGTALLRISEKLQGNSVGERILRRALKAPFEQVLKNLGREGHIEDYAEKVLKSAQIYDGKNDQFVDALEAGIVDPVKVTKTALSNAVSISSLLSTSGGAIVFKRKA